MARTDLVLISIVKLQVSVSSHTFPKTEVCHPPNQRRLFRTLQQVFIFALHLLQCLKPKEIHFLFKFGCVYKYHLSGLSTLNAMVSWPMSALKSSSFVSLPRGPENTENSQSL